MESLVANYASSDDEEELQQPQASSLPPKPVSSSSSAKTSSLFSALPQPKSSPLFSSIPQPKQQPQKNPVVETPMANNFDDDEDKPASSYNKSSCIFSSLPQPKSQAQQQSVSVEKPTKRVVQFKPPVPVRTQNFSDDDEDEDEEEKERKKRKQAEHLNQNSSVKSFLSSIPAPRSSATLGVLHSGSGSGRRSIIETEAPALSSSGFRAKNEAVSDTNVVNNANYDTDSDQNVVNYANYDGGSDQNVVNYANYEAGVDHTVGNYGSYGVDSDQSYVNYSNYQPGGDQVVHSGDASSYVNYGSYNGYEDYGQYGVATTVQETAGFSESGIRMPGKRGRNEIPAEMVEVKQDELIKNRPREDQVKLTGIAFGPSYQVITLKPFVFMCFIFLSFELDYGL